MKIHRYKKKSLRTNKKNKFFLKLFLLSIFFIFLAGGILYLLIFSGIFNINKVSVSGAKATGSETIERIAAEILSGKIFDRIPKNNPIFLPANQIEQSIIDNFPRVKSVILVKNIKEHTLAINISERETAAIWCQVLPVSPEVSSSTIQTSETVNLPSPENCFFIDQNGFIFGEAPILSGGALATVYEEGIRELKIKNNVSSPKILEFILEAKRSLVAVNLNLTDFIIKSQSVGELEIVTPEGWLIYLSVSYSPASQINALKRVLQEEIKENRSRLEYIDLRVSNRAFYKLK